MNCRPNGHKKGAAEVAAFLFNAFAGCIVLPTSVVLNLFQHLNFGPEAALDGTVFRQPYRLAQLQTEAQAIS
jgi:hypothetical protein